MPTLSEVKKEAINLGFVEFMESFDFMNAPTGFWFYRFRGDYLDYIGFTLKSSCEWMSVPITCIRYDILSEYNMDFFPKGFQNSAPFYSSTYINEDYGVEIGADSWCVKTTSDIEKSIELIKVQITKSANNWCKKINSNIKLYESFTINFKESENAQVIKRKLLLE